MTLDYGQDNLFGLMGIGDKLHQAGVSTTGASTAVFSNRIGNFADAVKRYQFALLDYRNTPKPDRAAVKAAEQRVHSAFQNMQQRFQLELSQTGSRTGPRPERNPLLNPERALNIARDSRHVSKLEVMNQVEASRLVHFTKHAKVLGGGLAVIDFGSRVGNVHNAYQANDDWHREMFVESSSFTLSVLAGSGAAKLGAGALGFLVVATPVGWAGLVVGGLAVAGVSAVTALTVNHAVKNNSGSVYDTIMKWIRRG